MLRSGAIVTLVSMLGACSSSVADVDGTGCKALPSVVYEDQNPGLDRTQLTHVMNETAARAECLRDIERDLADQTGPSAEAQNRLYAAEADAADAALSRLKIWNPEWSRPEPAALRFEPEG